MKFGKNPLIYLTVEMRVIRHAQNKVFSSSYSPLRM